MSQTNRQSDIADQVFKQIKTHQVKIKSKLRIFLEEVLFGSMLAIFLTLTILFLNIVFFQFHQAQLPPIPLFIALISLIFSFIFLKHYDFSYKTPFSLLFSLIILGILFSAFILSFSKINRHLSRQHFLHPFYNSPTLHLHHRFRRFRHLH